MQGCPDNFRLNMGAMFLAAAFFPCLCVVYSLVRIRAKKRKRSADDSRRKVVLAGENFCGTLEGSLRRQEGAGSGVRKIPLSYSLIHFLTYIFNDVNSVTLYYTDMTKAGTKLNSPLVSGLLFIE